MDLVKITELSNQLGLSSRSLRYYEQVGLIQSIRPEFEKYRYYDAENIERLKQIIVLRKMQIPIKDILRIYESEDMSTVVEIFVDRIHSIDEEMGALSELKRIVSDFLQIMIRNGITKISALPLLYEEVDKQLEVLEGHKPVTYEELSVVSEKLTKPVESAIIPLPAMRVLSSRLKEDQKKTDPDGFWLWQQERNILPGVPGRHEQFEYQTDMGDVILLRINEDFVNDSTYFDYNFEGGLFAAANVYLDEDINGRLRALVTSFDSNKYYEIDYEHDGSLRHEALIEPMISPDEKRELVSLFVPVKRRMVDVEHFEKGTFLDNVTVAELEVQNPVLWTKKADFASLSPREKSKLTPLDGGEVRFQQWLWPGVLPTGLQVKIPFRVDVEFRTELASLFITQNKGMMRVNGGYTNDHSHHRHSITLRQPVFGDEYTLNHIGATNLENINTASWIVGEKYIACILNGVVKICCANAPYMKLNTKSHFPHEIIIGSDQSGDHDFILKTIKVSQLAQSKKNILKKGDLTMITKQSNNILPDLHQLVTWHFGENYVFDGCMRFLMERIGSSETILADFDFFGGIGGDTIVQTYGHGFFRPFNIHDLPLSSFWDGADFVGYVFDEIGYEHTYVTHSQLGANKRMYIDTLMAYIDRGLPILQRWVPDASNKGSCYTLIVGYEENGKTLLYLDGDSAEPKKYETDGDIMWDWIFIGDKYREVDKKQLYKNCIKRMLDMMTAPDKYGCSYGAKAFRDWADDIENGWFAEGNEYTTYVCVLATNHRAITTFERILEIIPEYTFLHEIIDHYKKAFGSLWNDLENLGGGFNVTREAMQDKDKRKIIADKVREFAVHMDAVVLILEKNIT